MENSNTLYKMTKTVTHIDCPKEWESENDWDSHRPLLYLSIKHAPRGYIHELGKGFGSTELLSRYCQDNRGRQLFCIETDEEWSKKVDDVIPYKYRPSNILVNGTVVGVLKHVLTNVAGENCYQNSMALVFVDGKPGEERKDIIKEISEYAKIIVAHDTEESSDYVYGMKDVLSTFKYRLDYTPEGKPHTTAVSNTVNVASWV